MKQLLTRLVKEEQGQDVIEYGLLAAGISIVAIISINAVGGWVLSKWGAIQTGLGV
jgi:pilus assembly protein Flp/PilA